MFPEHMVLDQTEDVYQLSLLLFEMLFSSSRNLMKVGRRKYEAAVENFLNEYSDNRIPKNFLRSEAREVRTVSLNSKQRMVAF